MPLTLTSKAQAANAAGLGISLKKTLEVKLYGAEVAASAWSCFKPLNASHRSGPQRELCDVKSIKEGAPAEKGSTHWLPGMCAWVPRHHQKLGRDGPAGIGPRGSRNQRPLMGALLMLDIGNTSHNTTLLMVDISRDCLLRGVAHRGAAPSRDPLPQLLSL